MLRSDYKQRLLNFVIYLNNLSNSIKNIQIFITLLHEFGVEPTELNKPYSIYKEFRNNSHSYISYRNLNNKQQVIPKAIPPSTVNDLYFYLYNTTLRQQLRYKCFSEQNIEYKQNNNQYYNTEKLEKCYEHLNVMFRLIMCEYEKTILYHCIKYTMDMLNIDNNLHAVLCHDGYMLDKEYFNSGVFNYDTYLCDIKDYVYQQIGFNMDFEYKLHCDEIIPELENKCNEFNIKTDYHCDDNNVLSQNMYFNKKIKYLPKTKQEVSDITEDYYKHIDDSNSIKLHYNKRNYYHENDNIPNYIENNQDENNKHTSYPFYKEVTKFFVFK